MSQDTSTTEVAQARPSDGTAPAATGGGAASPWDSLVPPAADEEAEAQQAYQDPAVEQAAAELEEMPEWLGTRWRDLPQESMPEVWRWLRGWVDWLVEAHRVPGEEIPPCWFRHQDIVEELWGAANAEAQAWEATTPTMTPMTAWHFHLRMMRDRLKGKAKECVAGGKHVPAHSFRAGWGPSVLAVDENDWVAHLAEIIDTQPAPVDEGVKLWRMCAVDTQGEVITSQALDVGQVPQQAAVSISGPARRGADTEGNVLLGATVSTGGAGVDRTWWESSADGGLSWDKAVTSEVDRTAEVGPDEQHEQSETEQFETGEDDQA